MELSVIIPVFNESHTILEIVRRVQATGLANEIIIVDDGSTDGTCDLLATLEAAPGIRILHHDREGCIQCNLDLEIVESCADRDDRLGPFQGGAVIREQGIGGR